MTRTGNIEWHKMALRHAILVSQQEILCITSLFDHQHAWRGSNPGRVCHASSALPLHHESISGISGESAIEPCDKVTSR